MSNPVYGIRLDTRQAWAWRRLGNNQIRDWLAPEGICVECGSRPAKPATRNAWFCYLCQDLLDQQSLLPELASQTLRNQNQSLRVEVNKLRTQLQNQEQDTEPTVEHQLPLFQPEP